VLRELLSHHPATYFRFQDMPEQQVDHPYPLIDSDPYAGRVFRYMRPSDYAAWAGVTAAVPAGFYLLGDLSYQFSWLYLLIELDREGGSNSCTDRKGIKTLHLHWFHWRSHVCLSTVKL
jgi:hypothetical protein